MSVVFSLINAVCSYIHVFCVLLFVEVMALSVVALYLFYSVVGAVILIAMTTLAVAALRSTKSQVKRHSHTLETALRTLKTLL